MCEKMERDQSMRMAPSASSTMITSSSVLSVVCFDFLPEGVSSPRASAADRFTPEPVPFGIVAEEPLLFMDNPFVASSPLGLGDLFFRGIGEVGVSPLVTLVMSRLLIGLPSMAVLCQWLAQEMGAEKVYIRFLNIQHKVHPGVVIIFIDDGEEAVALDTCIIISQC